MNPTTLLVILGIYRPPIALMHVALILDALERLVISLDYLRLKNYLVIGGGLNIVVLQVNVSGNMNCINLQSNMFGQYVIISSLRCAQ
jgi:hypothetical protein